MPSVESDSLPRATLYEFRLRMGDPVEYVRQHDGKVLQTRKVRGLRDNQWVYLDGEEDPQRIPLLTLVQGRTWRKSS